MRMESAWPASCGRWMNGEIGVGKNRWNAHCSLPPGFVMGLTEFPIHASLRHLLPSDCCLR